MGYSLLAINDLPSEVIRLVLEYAACLFVIIASLVGLAFLKRKTKREMRKETVGNSCEKAKKIANEMLNSKENKSAYILLASTKLSHLSGAVAEAAWYCYQIVNGKKDIVYEGIAGTLDTLSTEIFTASSEGYLQQEEYKEKLENVIKTLDGVIEKLNMMR